MLDDMPTDAERALWEDVSLQVEALLREGHLTHVNLVQQWEAAGYQHHHAVRLAEALIPPWPYLVSERLRKLGLGVDYRPLEGRADTESVWFKKMLGFA